MITVLVGEFRAEIENVGGRFQATIFVGQTIATRTLYDTSLEALNEAQSTMGMTQKILDVARQQKRKVAAKPAR